MNQKSFSTHFLLIILFGLIFILNPLKIFAQDSLPSLEEVLKITSMPWEEEKQLKN